jgi:hypothetical protein
MPQLQALVITKPRFSSSLHFLTKMPNLRVLFIEDANITDLEPLAELSELRQLFLFDLPQVTDLQPLKQLSMPYPWKIAAGQKSRASAGFAKAQVFFDSRVRGSAYPGFGEKNAYCDTPSGYGFGGGPLE